MVKSRKGEGQEGEDCCCFVFHWVCSTAQALVYTWQAFRSIMNRYLYAHMALTSANMSDASEAIKKLVSDEAYFLELINTIFDQIGAGAVAASVFWFTRSWVAALVVLFTTWALLAAVGMAAAANLY